jgi:hypothetical protein
MIIPEMLFSESGGDSLVEGDLLIRGFFDTLRMIQAIVKNKQTDGDSISLSGLEGYTRQLLFDFVRILFLSNKSLLGEGRSGEVQIQYVPKLNGLTLAHRIGCLLIFRESNMLC